MVNRNTYHRIKKQRVMAVILAAAVIGIISALIAENFVLLLPLLLACFISKFVAKLVFRDNVYTYGRS